MQVPPPALASQAATAQRTDPSILGPKESIVRKRGHAKATVSTRRQSTKKGREVRGNIKKITALELPTNAYHT